MLDLSAGKAGRPIPKPDAMTSDFWASCKEGTLCIQRCADCGKFQHPPQSLCMNCGSLQVAFEGVSGRGVVAGWTTTYHESIPSLEAELPYLCVLIELIEQEDLFVVSDMIGSDVDSAALRLGMRMRVTSETQIGDLVVPRFVPCEDRERP